MKIPCEAQCTFCLATEDIDVEIGLSSIETGCAIVFKNRTIPVGWVKLGKRVACQLCISEGARASGFSTPCRKRSSNG